CFSPHTPATALYTLSLHDALPILGPGGIVAQTTHHFGEMIGAAVPTSDGGILAAGQKKFHAIAADGTRYESEEIIGPALHSRFRSEEHTSELQSRENLVCRLLLEK